VDALTPDQEMRDAARALLELCVQKKLTLATAESCTGGLLAATLTEIPGSSAIIERGFVTYTNEAKQEMLGVPAATLQSHGAVSRQTAEAMVKGALAHAPVNLAVSITGIAGPGGATPGKPVGLVHFAAAGRSGRLVACERRYGDIGRSEVRRCSVLQALAMLQEIAANEAPASPPAAE
jgi:nicotinamide-nucleotide amidase